MGRKASVRVEELGKGTIVGYDVKIYGTSFMGKLRPKHFSRSTIGEVIAEISDALQEMFQQRESKKSRRER